MSATPVAERAHEDGAAADAASAVTSTAVAKRAREGDLAGGAAGDAASAVTVTAVGKRPHDDAMAGGAAADAAPKRQCKREKEVRVSRMAMAGVTGIFSVLASGDGELFVGTMSALYLKSPSGRVTLIAGHPSEGGFKDGESTEARFNGITGLALMRDGGVLLVDHNNHSVRLVSPSGKVTTVAGNGKQGFADGYGDKARFHFPYNIVVDSNAWCAFVTDEFNHCIRRIRLFNSGSWDVETVCGKGQEKGYVNGPAEDARFDHPTGLALNREKDLIVADRDNNSVRKYTRASRCVTTVAGRLDGEGVQFYFENPSQVAVDGNNTILVSQDNLGDCDLVQISEEDGTVLTLVQGDENLYCRPFGMSIDKKGRLILSHYDPKYPLCVTHAGLVPPFPRPTTKKALRLLQADHSALFADQSLMDATFAVDGRVFRAHRVILGAHSPSFKQLFQANAVTDAQIPIADIPGPVFEIVLRYLYTGQYPPMTACAEGVSVLGVAWAAEMLDVQGLYQDCLEEFEEMLDVRHVIVDLIEAHKKGLSEFEDAAIEFIEENARCFCDEEWDRREEESLREFEGDPDLAGLLLRVTRSLVLKMGL